MIPFPNKKYQIIYADPPWRYRDKRVSITSDRPQKYGGISYNTMTIKEICELNIKEISHKNSVLFIWVTMPLLEKAFEVISAWGFKYITCGFVWVKINGNSDNKVYFTKKDIRSGLGSYTNANAELCLLARKGNYLERKNKNVKQVILAPIVTHSKKPSEVRDRIVGLYGDLPRIELFARPPKDLLFEDESYKGWDLWGNEV